MQGVTDIRIRIETSDAEVEKRLLNLLDNNGVLPDWSQLEYLLEFTDSVEVTHRHVKKTTKGGKRASKRGILGNR